MAQRRHRQAAQGWQMQAAWWGAVAALILGLASLGGRAQGTPTFSVDDVSLNEGDTGQTMVEFTVRLANPNGTESSIGFTTNDGTATGGQLTAPFHSGGPITLGDGPSAPYGVPITVSGVTGPVTSLSILLTSLAHPSPQDLDILLVAPSGETMVVQSDAGPAANPNTLSYILRDYNPPIVNSLLGGTYSPTSRSPADVFPSPAPTGPYPEAPPEGVATFSDVFRGIDPNGTWRVYIDDDTPGGTGTLDRITLTVGRQEPGTDFDHVFGRLTFPPGTTEQKVRVWANGDVITEGDETFFLDLGVPVNGTIGDGRGVGTIRNDDGGSGGLPPTTVNDAYQTTRHVPLAVTAPGVLANDMTNLGGAMSAQLVTPPSSGLLTLATDGSFIYVPGQNFVGTDSFTYRARNVAGNGNVATVTITVAPPAPPTAVDDRYVALGYEATVIQRDGANGLLSNDQANGGGPMTVQLVQGPAAGILTLRPDGGFTYRAAVTPFADSFTYRVINANGTTSNIATVSLLDEVTDGPYGPVNFEVAKIIGGVPRIPVGGPTTTGGRQVVLRFDPAPLVPNPDQYAITGGVLPGQTLAQIPTGSTYPIFEFTAPASGRYFLRAHAVTGSTLRSASNEIVLNLDPTTPPSPPENLLITVDGSNLTLAWNNTYLGGPPTNSILRVTGDANVTVPLGVTETFSFSGVPAGAYNFTVFNGNAGGVSADSNQVAGTFPGACSGPPRMPEDFLLHVRGRILGATWELPANGPAPNGYLLDVASPVFTGTVPLSGTSIEAPVPPGIYTASVRATTACAGPGMSTATQTVVVP
jgi:hypothetical protein